MRARPSPPVWDPGTANPKQRQFFASRALYTAYGGAKGGIQIVFKILPYIVTVIVLISISIRQKRESQPPASLGNAYFREER